MQLPYCVPAHFFLFFLLSTGKHTRRHPAMADFGFLGRKTSTRTVQTLLFLNTFNIRIVYAHGPRINNETGMATHACFYFRSKLEMCPWDTDAPTINKFA